MTKNEAPNTDTQLPSNIAKIDEATAEAFAMVSQQAEDSSGKRMRNERPNQLTGFKDIDDLTCGLWPGELTVVAGAPGVGKSSFAANVATSMASRGSKVMFFALGASKAETALLMCASQGRISARSLMTGRLAEGGWEALADAANKLSGLDLYICDDVSLTIEDLCELARQISDCPGRDHMVVVVDGVELLAPSDRKREPGWPRTAGNTAIPLKRLAREIGAPVLATVSCSAVSRDGSAAGHNRVLQALPPAFAAVADSVLHIARPVQCDGETSVSSLNVADVMLAKHRLCQPQSVRLAFIPEYLRFMDFLDDTELEG